MREDSTANDEVLRAVEFEQEQFARLERAEDTVSAGLPKVHFVEVRLCGEQLEPIAIRDADERLHEGRLASSSCRS